MKQITSFENGGQIEITQNGVKVISVSGEVLTFGSNGRLKEGVKLMSCSGEIFEIDENGKLQNSPDSKPSNWLKYFFLMGEKEREIVYKWYEKQKTKKLKYIEEQFLEHVEFALEKITYDYRISTIEPSRLEGGFIYFEENKEVYTGLTIGEWEEKVKAFAPRYGSDIANFYELILWYAYRIAQKYWTLSYVAYDSTNGGNYKNSPNAMHRMELTGARKTGGFFDGIGNTCKLIRDSELEQFAVCGGCYQDDGKLFAVADEMLEKDDADYVYENACPHIVLKGNDVKW